MIYNERNVRHERVMEVCKAMMTAARTAPKSKGVDIIEIASIDGEDLERLAQCMEQISDEMGLKFFLRDAGNVRESEAVVFIGTSEMPMGLNCGYCGYSTCGSRKEGVPCTLNSIDVGIAIGSACSMAADMRADSRVMFSAGIAAQRLGILSDKSVGQIIAIAVSASSKSPFFDRKPKQ